MQSRTRHGNVVFGDKIHFAIAALKYVCLGLIGHGWQYTDNMHCASAIGTGWIGGQRTYHFNQPRNAQNDLLRYTLKGNATVNPRRPVVPGGCEPPEIPLIKFP